MKPDPQTPGAIKAVATFEALKGFVALAAASGLLLLVHQDLHRLALLLVEHTHLNPAAKYPGIFIQAASHLQDLRLSLVAAGSAAYSVIRFIESFGLFRRAAWAEVLAALSGAIYVPFEVASFVRHPGWIGFAILAVNLAVVAVVTHALVRRRQAGSQHAA